MYFYFPCIFSLVFFPMYFPLVFFPILHLFSFLLDIMQAAGQRHAAAQANQAAGWVANPTPQGMAADGVTIFRTPSSRTPAGYIPMYRHLGTGGYGVVYCVRLAPMVTIARKVSAEVDSLRDERNVLIELRGCPHFVRLEDFQVRAGWARLDTELCAGDLDRLLSGHSNGRLVNVVTSEDGDRILYEVASGLQYLHARGRLHNDLKPANVLLTSSLVAKIADLGNSVLLGDDIADNPGTYLYNPPEADIVTIADARKDVWAYGLIALEVVMRASIPIVQANTAADGAAYARQFLNGHWNDARYRKIGRVTASIRGILELCLVEANARPGMQAILDGPFQGRTTRANAQAIALAAAERAANELRQREVDLRQEIERVGREKGEVEQRHAAAEAEAARNLATADVIRVAYRTADERANQLQQQLAQQEADSDRLRLEMEVIRAREHAAIAALENERQRNARPVAADMGTAMSVRVEPVADHTPLPLVVYTPIFLIFHLYT